MRKREGERKRGGVGGREGRSRVKWGGRKEGREGEREGGGTSARCRLAHLPEGAYNMGIPSVEGRRGGGGRAEGWKSWGGQQRRAVATTPHALTWNRCKKESSAKNWGEEMRDYRVRRAACGVTAAHSARHRRWRLGDITDFPFHFGSLLGVMLLGISIESMIHIPHVHPHLDTPCTMEFGSRHEYEHKVSIDINHDLKS